MRKVALIALAVSLVGGVYANAGMQTVFKNTYKQAKLNKCTTCHAGPPKLNAYGKDLQAALKGSKKLTAAVLKAVEKKDSDKDGKKNLAEIKAGTNPGGK